jgi:gluconate 5-dehydrogenase
MDPFRLDGQIALITGGGTGLGLGMARCFVRAGARVVLVGRREQALIEACDIFGAERATYQVHDVNETDRAGELLQRVERDVGTVSILVNNAGIHLKKSAEETMDDEFQRVMQTHVYGAFALTRAAIPGMKRLGGGAVLYTASMASLMGIPYVVAYSAAKSAYLGIVRTLGVEFAADGIRVNAVAPGWIESDMLNQALAGDPDRKNRILERTPMKRFGDSNDIGEAAVYLCSPAAKFVTGVLLPVDGGASMGF